VYRAPPTKIDYYSSNVSNYSTNMSNMSRYALHENKLLLPALLCPDCGSPESIV